MDELIDVVGEEKLKTSCPGTIVSRALLRSRYLLKGKGTRQDKETQSDSNLKLCSEGLDAVMARESPNLGRRVRSGVGLRGITCRELAQVPGQPRKEKCDFRYWR